MSTSNVVLIISVRKDSWDQMERDLEKMYGDDLYATEVGEGIISIETIEAVNG